MDKLLLKLLSICVYHFYGQAITAQYIQLTDCRVNGIMVADGAGVETSRQCRKSKCSISLECGVDPTTPSKCHCDWGECFCVELNRQWEFAKLRTHFGEICSLLQRSRSACDPSGSDEAFATSFLVSTVGRDALEVGAENTAYCVDPQPPKTGRRVSGVSSVCGNRSHVPCAGSPKCVCTVACTGPQKPGKKRRMSIHEVTSQNESHTSPDRSCPATDDCHVDDPEDIFQPRECFVRWIMERRSMCNLPHLDPLIPSPLPVPFLPAACQAAEESTERGSASRIACNKYCKGLDADENEHSRQLLTVKALEHEMLRRVQMLTSSQLLEEFRMLFTTLSTGEWANLNTWKSEGCTSCNISLIETVATEPSVGGTSDSDINISTDGENETTENGNCHDAKAGLFSWFKLISAASKLPVSMIEGAIFSPSVLRELQDEYPFPIFGQNRLSTCAAAEAFAIRVAEMIILQHEMWSAQHSSKELEGNGLFSKDSNALPHGRRDSSFDSVAVQRLLLPAGCCPSPEAVQLESLVVCLNELLHLLGAEHTPNEARHLDGTTPHERYRVSGTYVASCREAYEAFVASAKPCLVQIQSFARQRLRQQISDRTHSPQQNHHSQITHVGRRQLDVSASVKTNTTESTTAHARRMEPLDGDHNAFKVQLPTYLPLLKWPSLRSRFREMRESRGYSNESRSLLCEFAVDESKKCAKNPNCVANSYTPESAFLRSHVQWLLHMLRPVTWTFYGFYLLLSSAALCVSSFAAAKSAMTYSDEHAVAGEVPGAGNKNQESCFLKHFVAHCPRVQIAAMSATGESLPMSFGKTPDLSSGDAHLVGPLGWGLAWLRGRRFECLTLQGSVNFLEELQQEGPARAVSLVRTRFFIKAENLFNLWKQFLRQRRLTSKCCFCCGGCPKNDATAKASHCSKCSFRSPSAEHEANDNLEALLGDEVSSGFNKGCFCRRTNDSLRTCECTKRTLDLLFSVVRFNAAKSHGTGSCVISRVCREHSSPESASPEPSARSVYGGLACVCPCLVDLFISKVYTLLCRAFCVCGLAREGRGLSCSVPAPVLSSLERDLGGKILEGFASPLNARTSRFCSAFYDVDKDFGSLGSFFEDSWVSMQNPNNMLVIFLNPPFEETLIKRMESRIFQALDQNSSNDQDLERNTPLVFVVCLPDWSATARNVKGSCTEVLAANKDDTRNQMVPFASAVLSSRYLHSIALMDAEAHFYTSGYSHFCGPRFQSVCSPCSSVLCLLLNESTKRRLKLNPCDVLKNAAHAWETFSKGIMQSHKSTE